MGKFGKEIEKNLDTKSHETIQGLVKELVVYPVMGNDRDNDTKQIGHRIKIHFQLPIVKDQLSWNDEMDKTRGYTLKKGNKVYQTDHLPVNVGVDPKKTNKLGSEDGVNKLHYSKSSGNCRIAPPLQK